ncbi:MAG: hypothetical protein M1833_005695 [Piccolia ochrophora]|nr:MAG: hypothetical protein M1833_005695 [Piccolia ochrophora]
MAPHFQDQVQVASIDDPEAFWSHHAQQLHWHRSPSRALLTHTKELSSGVSHSHWTWFPDGEISTCYNCVDRHVQDGHGGSTAIIWDSPVTNTRQSFTYNELQREVESLASVLRDEGVQRGDVVMVYMPMIPAVLFACLAVLRLGAVHAVVFGGFSPPSLAHRIEASRPRAIMTASCGIEGAKGPTSYKPLIEEALQKSSFKPERVLVWQREQMKWDSINARKGERDWKMLVKVAKEKKMKAEAIAVKSQDPVYIIYTSGTTGLPKGVVRDAAGHAVGLSLSIKYLFGIRGPGDVMFCASDCGWVVGHSYILYAPLLAGATTVLFEGKPVGTPDAGTFWRILEEHKVNSLFTAPTALRAIRKEDPENKFFASVGKRGGLRNLRALFLAGERSEPSIVRMYQDLLSTHCAPGAQVIDNWWSTESGSPITGIAFHPSVGTPSAVESAKPLPVKPGSAGKPMPGFDVRIVDDDGNEVQHGEMGNIVLATPLAPTGFTTLWHDEDRFYSSYLERFAGKWLDTGDAGFRDEEGYISIMSRSDDIINVAAHRFSTGSIEQAISSHPSIAECCVVGVPDSLKGHLPFAFITLSTTPHPSSAVPSPDLTAEIQRLVRTQIGAIAALGGLVQGQGMIPKTRSGKTLRRVLRELLENAVHGEGDKEVSVPATVEDAAVVEVAREKVAEYFREKGRELHKAPETRAKL